MSGGGDPVRTTRRLPRWSPLLASGIALVAAGVFVLLVVFAHVDVPVAGNDSVSNDAGPTSSASPTLVSQVDRLVIPAISVDAPVVAKAVDSDGVMPAPDGPQQVVYYDFSALPGLGGSPGAGGNTVLAGHVDYHDYGPAVFAKLNDLKEGDRITVQLRDGTEYNYATQSNRLFDPSDTSFNEIVSATPEESLTLITCAGTFDSSTHQYDERRIVWAVRIG
ncbi:MAG: class F sortase [Dehalococcoidia bacterium]|jgi:LPXTG-site transpeptidase (sortase) family protein